MSSALFLAVACLALSGATYKATELRHQPRQPAWAFTTTLYLLGIALALRAPVIAQPLNSALHVPDLNVLIGNAATLTSACCVLTVLVFFTDKTEHRSRHKTGLWITLLLVALTSMTVLFGSALAAHPNSFVEGRTPQYIPYVLIYTAYLAAGMAEACRLCVHHIRHTADRYLRLGLSMIALGSAVGILYCIGLAYNVVAAHDHVTELGPWPVISVALPVACCALLIVGSTIGGWGPRLDDAWDRLIAYRSYRRLGPLWHALAEVAPHVIPPRDTANPTIGEKRYRRIIEIHDMILTLRTYRDPTIAAAAASTMSAEPTLAELASIEATVIAAAIQARREGRPQPPGNLDPTMPAQLGPDLATASAWLEAVSAAMARIHTSPATLPNTATIKDG